MEISKTSQKLHFRVTKKDTGLPFHFHVLNLFKSWSKLGFERDSNGYKKIKNAHSLFMSYNA
jgi:imidazoleglycerol phosphate dehydratase HisB